MRPRSGAGDEDAERVAGRVGVHPQRLLGVVRSVVEQPRAELERARMLLLELPQAGNRQVQVELLRDLVVRPGRFP